jgi:putative ABC transport system permease protein
MWFLHQLILAWRILIDRPGRFILSTVGVAFAVVIMFTELGFLNGVTDSSINFARRLNADLIIVHPESEHLKSGTEFPLFYLLQVRDVPGVQKAIPVYTSANYWSNPQDGGRNRVLIIGADLDDPMITLPELGQHREALRAPDTVLFDREARGELGEVIVGSRSKLAGRPERVVGLFQLGPNFAYEGTLFMSASNFLRLPRQRQEDVDLGMVRVAPGEDIRVVQKRINERLGKYVIALTPEEIVERERDITTRKAPVGIVFGIGLIVGFAIGVVVCYQILFNEVSDHLPQFAMLKAIGHLPRYLTALVMHEAIILSLGGYAIGALAGWGLYVALHDETRLQMDLSPPRLILVFALTTGMCLLAGRLALKKVHATDPAELY